MSTRGPLWRYFSKINIDTLVEISRWKKEQRQSGKDEASTTFADLRKRFGQHRKSIKNRMKKFYSRSSCEEDDDKVHARSNVNDNAHTTGVNHLSGHDACGSSSSESTDKMHRIGPKHEGLSAYFNKRDRHLFSSMLKKSRTSLTFDDVSRKKMIGLAAIGGRSGLKNKPNSNLEVNVHLYFFFFILLYCPNQNHIFNFFFLQPFQKNGCHSKFYD